MRRSGFGVGRTMAIRHPIDTDIVHLQRIICNTHANTHRPLPGFHLLPKIFGSDVSRDRSYSGIDCDEVYPNLFIGNEYAARNKAYLKLMGITHVVNTAQGKEMTQVDTDQIYYADANIKYLGINVLDMPSAHISIYFQECANFIERAMQEGGRVIVHCLMGISRSASVAIAYLMIKRNMSLEEALRVCRRHREIRPNDGFLRQLLDLERKLVTRR